MTSSTDNTPTAKPRKAEKKSHGMQGGSAEASRFAVVILEVLAGERTPADAAKATDVTLPRYYQLETRALEGLVAALEPRPKGKQPSSQGQITRLEKALAASRRECLRQQALVRAAQRSLGIKPPSVMDGKQANKDHAGHKKRRPAVRALKAARMLAHHTRPMETEALQQQCPIVRPAVESLESESAAAGGRSTTFQGASG